MWLIGDLRDQAELHIPLDESRILHTLEGPMVFDLCCDRGCDACYGGGSFRGTTHVLVVSDLELPKDDMNRRF